MRCFDAIYMQVQPASAQIARLLGEIPQTPVKRTAYNAGICVNYYLPEIVSRITSRLSLARVGNDARRDLLQA